MAEVTKGTRLIALDKGGAAYNAKAYGATGDGTTDDRAALVATEAAGGQCYLPAGTYLISSALTLSKAWTVAKGAKFKPASTVTLTVNGVIYSSDDPFDLSAGGTVSYGATGLVYTVDARSGVVRSGGNPFQVNSAHPTERQIVGYIMRREKPGGVAVGDEMLIVCNMADPSDDITPHCEFGYRVDGTPGALSVPMAFVVKTGAETSGGYERLRITSGLAADRSRGAHFLFNVPTELSVNNPAVGLAANEEAPNYELHGDAPSLVWVERDELLNERIWDVTAKGGVLLFRVQADGGTSVFDTWMEVQRTGASVDSIDVKKVMIHDAGVDHRDSVNVAHGMTDEAATDVYGRITKAESLAGGLHIIGLKDADGAPGLALQFSGYLGEAADTAKSAAAFGIADINAAVKAGATVGAVGAGGNLMTVRNATSTRWLVDAEGDVHYDGLTNASAWDEHDDIALLNSFRALTMQDRNAARRWFGGFIEEHADVLERTGVITRNRDGHHFVSTKGLNALIIDALRQLGARHERLEAAVRLGSPRAAALLERA